MDELEADGGNRALRSADGVPAARRITAVTIHDVAKAAGVATSTVSRALNGDGRVADSTRSRVTRVAQRLGYSPSRSARALRSARTRTLGFIAPDFANPIALTHLRAAVRVAFERGYTAFVCDAQGSSSILAAHLERMIEHRVDGILFGRGVLLLTPEVDRMLTNARMPVEPEITLPLPEDPLQLRAVNPYRERAELERGASLVAYRHLFQLGHRRIAYFARPVETRTIMTDTRLGTVYEAAAAAGLARDAVIEVSAASEDDCVPEVQVLAGLDDPPTAIICGNGVLTPGVLRGIYRAGWRIPDDISFLCFGDSVWHESQHPPLAVIRHDYAAAAERSLLRLIARAEGAVLIPDPPRSPAEFLPRSSLAPPRVSR